MPQISLYIDEKTLKKVKSAATQQNLSISKWVAEQIKAKINPEYTADFKNLFGSTKNSVLQDPVELSSRMDFVRAKF
jgi:hypothetical protein